MTVPAGTGAGAPLLSIVLCTRNRADRLGASLDALASLKAAHPFELILVDNASTDGTATALRTFVAGYAGMATALTCPRIGLGAARDFAWRHAHGAIVSFTDDDCYVDPGYVDALAAVFAENPDVGCVGGRVLLHNPAHARTSIQDASAPRRFPPRTFVPTGLIHGANFAFRRRVLEAIGGIDPTLGAGSRFKSGEDIDAIAGCVWAGYAALYDPRPTVRHDHGRLHHELPAMRRNYDIGRGAYYAKYLGRRDARAAYLAGWWRKRADTADRANYAAIVREIRAATGWMIAKRDYAGLATVMPVVTAGAVAIGARGAARRVRALGRRLIGRTRTSDDA